MIHDVCVIGAGWAGLTAASRLQSAGLDVVVVEKARGPGGRCATRRQDGFTFDHGAQYFTARSADFARAVANWKQAGLVAPWRPRVRVFGERPDDAGTPPDERLVACPGMNGVLRHLGGGLSCRYGWRATDLRQEQGLWKIRSEEAPASVLLARYLLVTAPPRQAADLVAGATELAERAARVPMNPCWALMLGFEQTLEAEFDAAFDNEGPLAWMARNASKPEREGESWVAHANPEWSAQHLEDEAASVAGELLAAFRRRVPSARGLTAIVLSAHRWRYALAPEPLRRDCLADESVGLVLAGDWCAGNRIEGAWTSGTAAAGQILDWVDAS